MQAFLPLKKEKNVSQLAIANSIKWHLLGGGQL